MKHLFWVAAALFALTACGKEEPAAPAEDVTAIEAPAPEAVADEAATDEAEEVATETLEVVEESASEEALEPEDQAIVLAVADTEVEAREWKYKEGQHYFRLMPTQPTVGGADKIEVA